MAGQPNIFQQGLDAIGSALGGFQRHTQELVTALTQPHDRHQQQQGISAKAQAFRHLAHSQPKVAPEPVAKEQAWASSGSTTVSKEELGRSTWTFLHTLAAQYPDKPSKQQQKDVRTLMDCLTRVYPCGECAGHFMEVLRANPPDVSSGPAFQHWMCSVHNTVNRRIGKPTFNCDLVQARWAPLDCGVEDACSLAVGVPGRK